MTAKSEAREAAELARFLENEAAQKAQKARLAEMEKNRKAQLEAEAQKHAAFLKTPAGQARLRAEADKELQALAVRKLMHAQQEANIQKLQKMEMDLVSAIKSPQIPLYPALNRYINYHDQLFNAKQVTTTSTSKAYDLLVSVIDGGNEYIISALLKTIHVDESLINLAIEQRQYSVLRLLINTFSNHADGFIISPCLQRLFASTPSQQAKSVFLNHCIYVIFSILKTEYDKKAPNYRNYPHSGSSLKMINRPCIAARRQLNAGYIKSSGSEKPLLDARNNICIKQINAFRYYRRFDREQLQVIYADLESRLSATTKPSPLFLLVNKLIHDQTIEVTLADIENIAECPEDEWIVDVLKKRVKREHQIKVFMHLFNETAHDFLLMARRKAQKKTSYLFLKSKSSLLTALISWLEKLNGIRTIDELISKPWVTLPSYFYSDNDGNDANIEFHLDAVLSFNRLLLLSSDQSLRELPMPPIQDSMTRGESQMAAFAPQKTPGELAFENAELCYPSAAAAAAPPGAAALAMSEPDYSSASAAAQSVLLSAQVTPGEMMSVYTGPSYSAAAAAAQSVLLSAQVTPGEMMSVYTGPSYSAAAAAAQSAASVISEPGYPSVSAAAARVAALVAPQLADNDVRMQARLEALPPPSYGSLSVIQASMFPAAPDHALPLYAPAPAPASSAQCHDSSKKLFG